MIANRQLYPPTEAGELMLADDHPDVVQHLHYSQNKVTKATIPPGRHAHKQGIVLFTRSANPLFLYERDAPHTQGSHFSREVPHTRVVFFTRSRLHFLREVVCMFYGESCEKNQNIRKIMKIRGISIYYERGSIFITRRGPHLLREGGLYLLREKNQACLFFTRQNVWHFYFLRERMCSISIFYEGECQAFLFFTRENV